MPNPYEKRILRVLDHIHENPGGDLSLDALADVAAMSRFHWHRVFRAMTGETCAEAARRVRLHLAACRLVQTDLDADAIARDVGYDNPQSFARTFKSAFGMTPQAFRSRGDLRSPLSYARTGDYPVFPIEVTTAPNRRLAALPHQGKYTEIGGVFEKISSIFTSRELWPQARGMVGVYYDDPHAVAEADLKSHAGVVVEDDFDMPDDLEDIRATGGKVAVMHYKGPYAGLQAAYDYMYGVWLPESGEEPGDAPPHEVYLNAPQDTAPDDLLTDVVVPLKG